MKQWVVHSWSAESVRAQWSGLIWDLSAWSSYSHLRWILFQFLLKVDLWLLLFLQNWWRWWWWHRWRHQWWWWRLVGQTFFTAATATVHEALPQRSTQAEDQNGRGRGPDEHQELTNQSQQCQHGTIHLHSRVGESDVPGVFREAEHSVNDR